MKLAMFIFVLVATSAAFAQTPPQNCFTITNTIDRKYCIDKYLETVKNKLAAEKKTWSAGLAGDAKEARTEAINNDIQSKKDQKGLIDSEIAMQEKHLADLNAVVVKTPAAPKKKKDKKKDKKKLPFGIKL